MARVRQGPDEGPEPRQSGAGKEEAPDSLNSPDEQDITGAATVPDIPVRQTFAAFIRLGRPYLYWYMIRAVLAIAAAPLGVAALEAIRRFINAAADRNVQLLYSGELLFAASLAGGIAISLLGSYCDQRLTNQSTAGVQKALFRKILKTDLSRLQNYHSGDLISRISQSATSAQTGLNNKVNDLVKNLSQMAFYLIYLIAIHPMLTLYAVLFAGIVPLLLMIRLKKLRIWMENRQRMTSDLNAFVQDVIIGAETVRASMLVDKVNRIYAAKHSALKRLSARIAMFQGISSQLRALMSFAAMLFIFGYGGHLVYNGVLDLGALVVFAASYRSISGPLSALAGLWTQLQQDIVHAARLFHVHQLPSDSQGELACSFDAALRNRIELRDVAYSYKDGEKTVRQISFIARMNEITAIVGPSGSGKSTLMKLILGLYRPLSGEIRIGDVPVQDIQPEAWRRDIAYVPQSPYLFSGTVYDNIACGRPDATEAEVREAARAARIHDKIMSLPDQYETDVKERGLSLSGGEKQRLAIARALLRNPAILLLDEASSALDRDNERGIQATLKEMARGRIIIMITHRLSAASEADNIILLDGGELAEQGSFAGLMRRKGAFYRLYRAAELGGRRAYAETQTGG